MRCVSVFSASCSAVVICTGNAAKLHLAGNLSLLSSNDMVVTKRKRHTRYRNCVHRLNMNEENLFLLEAVLNFYRKIFETVFEWIY